MKYPKLGKMNNKAVRKLSMLEKRYTNEEIEQTILKMHGVVTYICSALDCTYRQFEEYLGRNIEMKDVLNKAKESLIDYAEHTLIDCLNSDDEKIKLNAAEFVLKGPGKKRGWSQNEISLLQSAELDEEGKIKKIKTIFGMPDETV